MNKQEVSHAETLLDKGQPAKLYEYLAPFLKVDDPYALYYMSRFSLAEWNESEEDFNRRSVDLLSKAAERNVPEAMHRLALLYFVGDGVDRDVSEGKRYLDRACELGCWPAKLSLAANALYGSNGYTRDIKLARRIATDGKSRNVKGAAELLDAVLAAVNENPNK